jgi:DNA-binding NarL/FixJ family response regulator
LDNTIRIVLADDHPIFRKGLRDTIEEHDEFKVIAEVGDGKSALDQILRLKPDIAIVDIDMPRLDGLDAAREVKKLELPTKIIFLTMHTDSEFFDAAFAAGGQGYILKDSVEDEIVGGIRAVCSGQMYVSPGMTKLLLQKKMAKPARELRVTDLLKLLQSAML